MKETQIFKTPSIILVHTHFFPICTFYSKCPSTLGWFKNPVSSQTDKLMAGTKFSDYLGLKHYKKAKKLKHSIHLRLANWP